MYQPSLRINYTGKTMGDYPENSYGAYCPATAMAYEVVDVNGNSKFIGTHQACENYINS
jgi:hypothetical protein